MKAASLDNIQDSNRSQSPVYSDSNRSRTSSTISKNRQLACQLRCNDPFRGGTGETSRENKRVIRKLILSIVLCVIFTIAEFVGGKLAGSLAVYTDAAHLLSDVAGFLISLFAITWSQKSANSSLSFGYHRVEILGALISISMVWIATFYILVEAFDRFSNPVAVNGKIMVIVAAIGVAVNCIIGFVLHDSHHGHSHHSHDLDLEDDHHSFLQSPTSHEGEDHCQNHQHHHEHQNINLRAAFIHAISDVIQSIGVLITALIVWFCPEWQKIDLYCTFLSSILVILSTWYLTRDTLLILMEGTPRNVNLSLLIRRLASVEGVLQVHDVHVWSLSPGKAAATAHIIIDWDLNNKSGGLLYSQILNECHRLICALSVHHVTIQIDPPLSSGDFHCRSDCCGSVDNFLQNS